MGKHALARVSTKEQNEKRQVNMFLALGVPIQNIFVEKESGKSTTRVKFHKFIKKLKQGDTLYIENIDRLARDYDGILDLWHTLTKKKGVVMKVLDTPLLDTDNPASDLLSKFIRNIILHILAFQAELEWVKIKSRQAQGIATAKKDGKHLGRPKKPLVIKKRDFEIIAQWKNGDISEAKAMKRLRRGKANFYKLVKIYEQKIKDGDVR
jgi:DNA invertase Pin-like site-specific DNA recombinase